VEEKNPIQIVVTGDRDTNSESFPKEFNGRQALWHSIPVLEYERIPVSAELLKRVEEKPFEWILFASPRAVQFWTETLVEHGIEFPLETQVACIGAKTAEAAALDGYNPDFFPTEPGTECFLKEFEDLISNNQVKPSLLQPASEYGRKDISLKLRSLGCEYVLEPIYRTVPKQWGEDGQWDGAISKAQVIVFTSPSSVDAWLKNFSVPSQAKLAAFGQFTSEYMSQVGLKNHQILPQSDWTALEKLMERASE